MENRCKQYINNCPMRCNTKQSIYYSASSLYMFQVSTIPIIRSTQNCNYSCAAAQKIWPVPEAVTTAVQLHKKYDQYRRL